MVCNINLAMYGGDMYIAAMTIINSVREVIHMPVSGVGNGAQPVMSFNYGAKEYGRVKQTIRYTAVILLVYTLFAWGMTMLFPNQFVIIFNKDAELLPLTVKSMHIYSVSYTHLLKTLVGELPKLGGQFSFGTGVEWGYFDQQAAVAESQNPKMTIMEDFWEEYPTLKEVEVRLSLIHI